MTPEIERAVITASLLKKFAGMTEPQKRLARQVIKCRSCVSQATCNAGCRFLGDLVALPACPLGRASI